MILPAIPRSVPVDYSHSVEKYTLHVIITFDESVVRFDVLGILALHSKQSGLNRIHVGVMPTFPLSPVDRLCESVCTLDERHRRTFRISRITPLRVLTVR